MSLDVRTPTLVDTSILLNFLAVDRVDLLSRHPALRFIVTNHVHGEITDRHPEWLARFESAIEQGLLQQASVSDPNELEVFGQLQRISQLGVGESAAAAAAVVLGVQMATDDRRAAKILTRTFPKLALLDTAQIIRDLIQAKVLTIAEADGLKAKWETRDHLKLPFASFAP